MYRLDFSRDISRVGNPLTVCVWEHETAKSVDIIVQDLFSTKEDLRTHLTDTLETIDAQI